MPLVNQYEITLRDFLPTQADAKVIADRTLGTTITVSIRLYAMLTAYADQNQVPLGDVVAPLREEVQGS